MNGYAHDESGVTTEETDLVARMAEKRLRKEGELKKAIGRYPQVNLSGQQERDGGAALLGIRRQVSARKLPARWASGWSGRLCSPRSPADHIRKALEGAGMVIAVEENATAQLATLASRYGITCDKTILRYDGRPFTPELLREKVKGVLS